jgi:RNA polymerase sigma factor (sigma-70 family)
MANAQLVVVLRQLRRLAVTRPVDDLPDGELLDRFRSGRDEAAFAALVRRHGRLVLGVCRRVLRHEQDAEDAFQAAFLVLARRAGSIRKPGSLGSWLYGVAYHIASQARRQAHRRERRERQAAEPAPAGPCADTPWSDWQPVLDEEIQRLPAKYRLPLVLCYLEGKSNREAAGILGVPEGSMSWRLARARDLLRHHLTRRGVVLSGAVLGTGLAAELAPAAAPPALTRAAVKAALLFTPDRAGALTSAPAVRLAQGALKTMTWNKGKIATVVLLVAGLLGLGALGRPADARKLPSQKGGPSQPPADQKKITPPRGNPAAQEKHTIAVAGKVLDTAGKPRAGADVAFFGQENTGYLPYGFKGKLLARGRSDSKGRFLLRPPKAALSELDHFHVAAGVKGFALGWHQVGFNEKMPAEVVLRLPPEQVIKGRLFNLQGVPAANVKARVFFAWGKKADIGPAFRALGGLGLPGAGKKFRQRQWFPFQVSPAPKGLSFWPGPITTDVQGRFRVGGFGPGQDVELVIEDDRFATQQVRLENPKGNKPREVARSLAPAQTIEGRVVYEDTGKPVPRARVKVLSNGKNPPAEMSGRADAEGRFRLNPYPGDSFALTVDPPPDRPYLGVWKDIAWPKGAASRKVKFTLPRGVLLKGKAVDQSQKPVAGARVYYHLLPDPSVKRRADLAFAGLLPDLTRADGTFQRVVPPGPVYLMVDVPGQGFVARTIGHNELFLGKPGGKRRYFHGLKRLGVKAQQGPRDVTLTLRRGVTVRGKVVGPDGKPVRQAVVYGPAEILRGIRPIDSDLNGGFPVRSPGLLVHDGTFEIPGCDPDKTYRIFILDNPNPGRETDWKPVMPAGGKDAGAAPLVPVRLPVEAKLLGAMAEVSAKKAGGKPITVKLAPCGWAQARVVNRSGKPVSIILQVELVITSARQAKGRAGLKPEGLVVNYWLDWHGDRLKPNAEARLATTPLIPGATYRLKVMESPELTRTRAEKEFTVESGKAVRLGELVIK